MPTAEIKIKAPKPTRIYQTPFMAKSELGRSIFLVGSDIVQKDTGVSSIAVGPAKKASQDLRISDAEGRLLTSKLREIWVKEARKLLPGTSFNDYERAIRISFERGSLRVGLEGWEAVSIDKGWRPDPGGLVAGIGKYDGTVYDMKPMLLKGASRRVIPMRLTGTRKEIKDKIFQHFEEGAIAPRDGTTSIPGVKGKIGSLVQAAFGLEKGSRLKLKGSSGGDDDDEGDDEEGGGGFRRTPLQGAGFGPGKAREGYTRKGANRPGRRFTKSIIEDAVRAGDLPSPAKRPSRAAVANFIVFRTVTDGTVNPKFQVSKSGRMTKKHRRALKSAEAMKHKWLTAGRKGIDLMNKIAALAAEISADIMAKRGAGFVSKTYINSLIRTKGVAAFPGATKKPGGSRGVR